MAEKTTFDGFWQNVIAESSAPGFVFFFRLAKYLNLA